MKWVKPRWLNKNITRKTNQPSSKLIASTIRPSMVQGEISCFIRNSQESNLGARSQLELLRSTTFSLAACFLSLRVRKTEIFGFLVVVQWFGTFGTGLKSGDGQEWRADVPWFAMLCWGAIPSSMRQLMRWTDDSGSFRVNSSRNFLYIRKRPGDVEWKDLPMGQNM